MNRQEGAHAPTHQTDPAVWHPLFPSLPWNVSFSLAPYWTVWTWRGIWAVTCLERSLTHTPVHIPPVHHGLLNWFSVLYLSSFQGRDFTCFVTLLGPNGRFVNLSIETFVKYQRHTILSGGLDHRNKFLPLPEKSALKSHAFWGAEVGSVDIRRLSRTPVLQLCFLVLMKQFTSNRGPAWWPTSINSSTGEAGLEFVSSLGYIEKPKNKNHKRGIEMGSKGKRQNEKM